MAFVPKYETKRARVFLERYGTGILRDVFNVDSFTVGAEENILKKKSTSEVIGDIAVKTLDQTWSGNITFGSTDFDLFCELFRAKQSVQASTTAEAFTFPALKAGEGFKLSHGLISAITVPGLVENVDYVVYKQSGIVIAKRDVTAPVTGGEYSAGVGRIAGIGAAEQPYYTFHVADELGGEYTRWFKVQMQLPKDVQHISPNEFGVYTVPLTFVLDESMPPAGDFGQYGTRLSA